MQLCGVASSEPDRVGMHQVSQKGIEENAKLPIIKLALIGRLILAVQVSQMRSFY